MRFLPIVTRELRVASRRAATYRNRVVLFGAVGTLAVGVLLFGSLAIAPSHVGSALFQTITWIALVVCLLAGVLKTADSLSEEKREGTLGLLFLTDLKGYDVVLGKFAAMSLGSMHGLLSLFPLVAVCFFLGGVTAAEFWRMVLALAGIQFFSLCAGIAISASSRLQRRAICGTILLIAVVVGLPFLTRSPRCFPLSPVYAFMSAFDSTYVTAASGYWHSIQSTLTTSCLLLLWASFVAPRRWREQPRGAESNEWRERFNRWRFGNARRRAALRTQMLEINPIYWLAGRDLGQRRLLWLVLGVTGSGAAILLLHSRASFLPRFLHLIPPIGYVFGLGLFSQAWISVVWLVNFLLKVRLASQACHCLAEARRNQSVEMLLSTPLTVKDLIAGQIAALQQTFIVPLVTIITIEIIGGLSSGTASQSAQEPLVIRGLGTLYFIMFFLDAVAVTWAGMWFGLSSRKETEAATKTIGLVLVFPLACVFFWPLGGLIMFAVPVFWIIYCRSRLLKQFRIVAAQRHAFQHQARLATLYARQ